MPKSRLTFLGHASFRLTLPDERVVMIDPWMADNPVCPDSEKHPSRCDFVVLTHAHFDHVGDVPALIQKHNPKVVAMLELAGQFESRYPKGTYHPMGIGGTQELDGIRFSMTPAVHSSGFQSEGAWHFGGTPAGVVIAASGMPTIYHAGDTDVFGDMRFIQELYAPEVVILPIGDHFTMGPRAAALAASMFKPRTIIPVHYGTFPVLTGTVEAFKQHLGSESAGKVVALKPGETFEC